LPDLVLAVDPDRDHLRGRPDAAVQLVEYADFQCGVCAEARPAVEQAREAMGDRLLVVFRHLPVPRSHPRAVPAALTAEAAGAQGAFWEMHDRLFANQDRLSREDLLDHARALGLDVEEVATVLDQERAAPRIEEDVDSALRSGVTGTPGFFVNGRLVTDGWADGALLDAVRRAAGDDVDVA
jgi:protein-disulfide isomerase